MIDEQYVKLSKKMASLLRYSELTRQCCPTVGDGFFDVNGIVALLGSVRIGDVRRSPSVDEVIYVAENSSHPRRLTKRFTLHLDGPIGVAANYRYNSSSPRRERRDRRHPDSQPFESSTRKQSDSKSNSSMQEQEHLNQSEAKGSGHTGEFSTSTKPKGKQEQYYFEPRKNEYQNTENVTPTNVPEKTCVRLDSEATRGNYEQEKLPALIPESTYECWRSEEEVEKWDEEAGYWEGDTWIASPHRNEPKWEAPGGEYGKEGFQEVWEADAKYQDILNTCRDEDNCEDWRHEQGENDVWTQKEYQEYQDWQYEQSRKNADQCEDWINEQNQEYLHGEWEDGAQYTTPKIQTEQRYEQAKDNWTCSPAKKSEKIIEGAQRERSICPEVHGSSCPPGLPGKPAQKSEIIEEGLRAQFSEREGTMRDNMCPEAPGSSTPGPPTKPQRFRPPPALLPLPREPLDTSLEVPSHRPRPPIPPPVPLSTLPPSTLSAPKPRPALPPRSMLRPLLPPGMTSGAKQ